MKYVLKPLGGHAAGGGADGTSELSAAQAGQAASPPRPSGTLGKLLTSLAAERRL